MWLWIFLLALNMYGFIINVMNGSAFWAAISAVGVVLCLRAIIPTKQS